MARIVAHARHGARPVRPVGPRFVPGPGRSITCGCRPRVAGRRVATTPHPEPADMNPIDMPAPHAHPTVMALRDMAPPDTRRHDIDALRAIAFGLLILYHCCMLWVAGEDWDWHLKSAYQGEWLQLPMLLVNRWRMDLIFLISGLSVHFLLRGTGAGRFVASRSFRLLLPLVFGCLLIVPV